MIKYTDYEKEIAIDFAKDLINCGIEYYLAPSSYTEKRMGRQDFYKKLEVLPYDTCVASGATRGVFMRNDGELDRWVIKADFKTNSYHYCALEAQYYEEAVAEGVDWAFAATYFLTEINGIYFYIQERLNCDCQDSTSEKLRDYIINECGVVQEEDEDDLDFQSRIWDYEDSWLEWDDVLVCLIGDADVEEFIYSHGINDLHEANYGLTEEGYFKVVDFCGYNE